MLEIVAWILLGTWIGYAFGRGRSRRPSRPRVARPGRGEGGDDQQPLGQRLLRIGDDLEDNEAGKMADPHDILGNPKFEKGVAMLTSTEVTLEQVVGYALGTHWVVGIMASEALARRPDAQPAVERVLSNIGQWAQWPLFFRLRFLAAHADRPVIGPVLVEVRDWWGKEPVTVAAVDEFIGQRYEAGETVSLGGILEDVPVTRLDEIEAFIQRLDPRYGAGLLDEIARHREEMLDPQFVASAGRLWTGPIPGPAFFETERLTGHLASMRDAFGARPPRSILLVGEPGVGKTALIRAFSKDLTNHGWRLFQTSGSEMLAGTRYVGDIETRVDQLRRNACVAKRVALVVDGFAELTTAGRTKQHPVGVFDLIWPFVKSQELLLVSEVAPGAYQTLERAYPGLPVVVKVIRVAPLDEQESEDLGKALVSRMQPQADDATREAVVREALQLARTYLAHRALPGSAMGLLELALARASTGVATEPIDRSHLLGGLSELTGLPPEVLDERQRLDVEGLRGQFQRHVIGQDEAVDCLVERIAMLKAGLTDPKRPIGVYLFAGPTGTGKTEIAKTLAELLFGSPEQMIRLDMSEFQTSDSLPRLLGATDADPMPGGSASLVQRIRERPFSVVLLDEFEKAHQNVWDLFLQVFDDGRLTDRQGNLADFRHAIIIVTSNLGATIRKEAGVGFLGTAGEFYASEVMRAVNRTFRREFINRLDNVVVFNPLSRDVMRRILRKELDEALNRRGLQSKAWAVEWEDSAIEFLLSKGFTPDLGARPLRRAIETHLLAPLSVTIVENRAPEGEQFLFVRSDGQGLHVEFLDPDAEPEPAGTGEDEAASTSLTVPGLVLEATGDETERRFLSERVARIVSRVEGPEWEALMTDALAQINTDGFWDREDRYDVLDRVELMDRIQTAAATLGSLAERLERSGRGAPLARRVAEKLYVLEAGLEDLDLARPGMAFLGIRLVREDADRPEAGDFLARIEDMYSSWASRRRMRWVQLTPRRVDPVDGVVYSVTGFGCHSILEREAGLHVLETPREPSGFERVRVRVSVAPQLVAPSTPKSEQLDAAREAFGTGESRVVRRYRESPSPLVRDSVAGWRTGRIDAIWAGDFDVWRS